MKWRSFAFLLAAVIVVTAIPSPAGAAGGTPYKDGDSYVKFGGRIQLQYLIEDPDGGDSTDTIFFRRFRPYIEGSVHKDWKGKFRWDMGKAEGSNEIAIKDAYAQYKGFDAFTVTIGNANFPFSRELLTSSKEQQLVERTFVGNHNYGTPDRNPGIHLAGDSADKMVAWAFSMAQASIDPDDDKLDFDTPVNCNGDFRDGWMYGGRVDWHPMGYLKMSQGDFKADMKITFGAAAFTWSSDEDNSPAANDVDTVTGLEVSGAFGAAGFSADVEFNSFNAETVDSALTGGLYEDGQTELTNYSLEAGHMVMP